MAFARKIETVTVATVTLVALVISLLDLAGLLDGIGWLRNRIPVLTLLAVGALAAYLVTEQSLTERRQSSVVQSAVGQLAAKLSVTESHEFDTRAKFWLYAAKRIRESKSTIDDLTWGMVTPTAMTLVDEKAYGEYRHEIGTASSGKGANRDKVYREIMSFPNDVRLGRAIPLLNSDRYPNFQLRCYRYDHSGTPPLLQFYVFDKEEVLISLTPLTNSARDSRYMTYKKQADGGPDVGLLRGRMALRHHTKALPADRMADSLRNRR